MLYTSKIPATEPGTPTECTPKLLFPGITFPSLSKYISLSAVKGAFSLKSRAPVFPSLERYTINPPPPIFPATGYTTANANCVATIASYALPPFFKMSEPICDASALAETTMALSVTSPTTFSLVGSAQLTINNPIKNKASNFFIMFGFLD